MPSISIIGAGPAGTIASIVLARAGINVTLIEQHRFPRDKVCGECLSALGIDVLDELKLREVVKELRPRVLQRAVLHASDGVSAEFKLPRPMRGISRSALDEALLQAARSAGVTILLPVRCEAIETAPTPTVHVRMLESNTAATINSDFIVLADGKAAFMPAPPASTDDFGFKAHFSGVDAGVDAIELFGVDGHYGGIAPIEGGRWNIAFSVPAARLKSHGRNFDSLFKEIVKENDALSRCMRQASRVSDWLISPLPRFPVASVWPHGVIPIGNAAAAIEPVGGEGMGLAMRSAELAAGAIIAAIRSGTDVNTMRLRSEYRELWNTRRLACRVGARIISSPALARLAVAFAGCTSGPGTIALRLVGK